MIIAGEKFYYMHNHHEAKFDISEIQALMVQPVEVATVDLDTEEVVGETSVYLVLVVIDDETFAATRPISSETRAHHIASMLQKKLMRHFGGSQD